MIRGEWKLDLGPLDRMRKGGVRKAIRIGINRAARLPKLDVTTEAQRIARYGFIAKSIRIKVILHKNGGATTVIGPSTKFKRKKGKYKFGPRKGQPREFRPARYAHLVERGTVHAAPKRFMRPAFNRTVGPFFRMAQREIGNELAKIAR